jgi:RNA polymerase sigma factor (sigma-70 family)
MATAEPLGRLVGQLRRAAEANNLADAGDAALLDRFRTHKDTAAFEALVRRHGPLVLTACRRVLGSAADVDDVFQATFLVLLRKPHAIRKGRSVGSWLYGVAHRLAVQARDGAARRQRLERRAVKAGEAESPDLSWREACALLHRELDRLPDKYRLPLLLCYFEGQSRDQAARKLGWSMNVVRGRLERGRDLLRSRLARRGVALSAGLIATLGDSATADGLPPSLVQATLRAAAGSPPAAVAALLRGVTPTMLPRTLKYAAGFVVAFGLLAGAVALRPAATVNATPAEPPKEGARPPAADGASTTYSGRVLDPDGKPVAGAKLYAVYYTPKILPIPERGTTDKDGSYRFTVPNSEFDRSASAQPWNEVIVFAVTDGFGLSFPEFDPTKRWSHEDQTLKLTKDEPITGKITDLQGKPVAGATVTVHELWLPTKTKDLSALVDAVKAKQALQEFMINERFLQTGLWMGRDVGRILPPAVTDAQGRVTVKGIGRERVVKLRIDGPTITTAELWGMTRAGENMRLQDQGIGGQEVRLVGTSFEHFASPALPITGVVTDKDTGKPIAGATIEGFQFNRQSVTPAVRTTTDKDGHYRLVGVPKGAGNRIRVRGPENEPYVPVELGAADNQGLVPATVDVALKRGVWIVGKVTDKATGKPVPSWIKYALGDNPHLKDYPNVSFATELRTDPADGTFRFAGLPGRALIGAQAHETDRYQTGLGADAIKDLRQFTLPVAGAFGMFSPEYLHAMAEIKPETGAESVTCNLVVVPARTLTGRVVGPDGQPLAGALVRGLQHPEIWETDAASTAEFTVRDVKSNEPRLVQVMHAEKKLAGSVVIHGDEKGPVTVKLEAAATLTGRFVTADGKPLGELAVYPKTMDPLADIRMPPKFDTTAGSFPRNVRTDKDGRFHIEGLAPGLSYRVQIQRGMFVLSPEGKQAERVTLKAGETKDLGDLRIRLPGQDE